MKTIVEIDSNAKVSIDSIQICIRDVYGRTVNSVRAIPQSEQGGTWESVWRNECCDICDALAELLNIPKDPRTGWVTCIKMIKERLLTHKLPQPEQRQGRVFQETLNRLADDIVKYLSHSENRDVYHTEKFIRNWQPIPTQAEQGEKVKDKIDIK